MVTRAGFEEHNVCRKCSSSGPLGPHDRGQSRAAFGHIRYKKGGMSFASCFPASALRVWPSCSEGHEQLPTIPVIGAEQILGMKNWGMLLQLFTSHHQSQATLYETVSWAKNVFQKRALEKHLLVGDCGHIFLIFLFLSTQGPCCCGGTGDGEDCLTSLLVSVSYILQYSSSSLVGSYHAEWW